MKAKTKERRFNANTLTVACKKTQPLLPPANRLHRIETP
jgi:hypothetical protein